MPRRTVGGNYGLAGYNPQNRLTDQQVLAQAGGNQYAPLGNAPYAPGAFGGAQPGMVAGLGGMRQGWLGNQAQPEMGGTPESIGLANAGLSAKGYVQSPAGQWSRPGVSTGGLAGPMGIPGMMPGVSAAPPGGSPMGYGGMGLAGMGGMGGMSVSEQNRQAARQVTLNRVGLRRQNKVDAYQSQMEAMNPQYGLAMAQLRQQGTTDSARLGLADRRLVQEGDLARAGFEQKTLDRQQRGELAKLQTEQAGLQRAHEFAVRRGDHEAAAKLAKQHDENAMKVVELQLSTQKGLAAISSQDARERNRLAGIQGQIQGLAALLPILQQSDPEGAAVLGQQLPGLLTQLNPAAATGGLAGVTGPSGSPPGIAGVAQNVLGATPPGGLAAVSPVMAQRGLAAAGNNFLNQRLDALGQGLEGVPRNAIPLHVYQPLHTLSSELQQLEKQGHITAANKRQVAAALRSRMPESVLGTLGQVEDQRMSGFDPYGVDRKHATYLRNFFGVPFTPAPVTESPYGIYAHGPY
jgi:hypothetical protein